jgi:hypothetical protein
MVDAEKKELKILGRAIPESQYVNRTLTIRDMALPSDVTLTKQSLLRWFALSIGALSESESRNTIVPILDALLHYQAKERRSPSVEEIKEYLDRENWGMRGKEFEREIPEKAIRYHLGKLRDIGLVEMKNRRYSFVLNPENPEIETAVKYAFEAPLKNSLERLDSAFRQLLKMY